MEPKLERIQYYKGSKPLETKLYKVNDNYRPGKSRLLPLIDEMLLTLMKIRMNLMHEDLAKHF